MRALASSPSSGEFEVLHALFAARGHDGNYVKVARIRRKFPNRTTAAEVTTALNAASGTYVETNGSGGYRLTAAGVARSRAHRPRRWIPIAC